MKKKGVKISLIILATFFFLILSLFLIRAFSERELDDVSPEMTCDRQILEKSDILWVIPNFNQRPISENKEWCKEILSLNKTIGMHGVNHTFNEFGIARDQEYLERGINIFEECFGFKPTIFKPSQLKITKDNRELIKKNKLILKEESNQIIHKVYHCDEYGEKRNWLVDLF